MAEVQRTSVSVAEIWRRAGLLCVAGVTWNLSRDHGSHSVTWFAMTRNPELHGGFKVQYLYR